MWNNIERSYFVYGHYRKDSNELFYIGIGKKRVGNLLSFLEYLLMPTYWMCLTRRESVLKDGR